MAHEIVIPRLGWSMEEGTFIGWLMRDGDLVKPGDALFELESEKSAQPIEAIDAGILRIPPSAPADGSVVAVGTVVGYLTTADEPLPWQSAAPSQPPAAASNNTVANNTVTNNTNGGSASPPAGPTVRRLAREMGVPLEAVRGTGARGRVLVDDVKVAVQQTPSLVSPLTSTAGCRTNRPVASPRARRVARELGIEWQSLSGSGANGRIREQDVLAARGSKHSPESIPPAQRQPIGGRRRLIAQRMLASSQTTAPVTLTTRADATNLVNLREQFKSASASSLIPSYQDLLIKLAAEVLPRHAIMASRWEGDDVVTPADNGYHIGMAVDTPAGLVVPVLQDVRALSVARVAEESRALIERARAGKLSSADMQGGVFTVSNLGAYGIDGFTPIINLPEVAILGLGAIRREAVALDDGQIVPRHQWTLSLTFDHRVVDGAPAARFLQELVNAIANPSAWLLSH